MDIMKMQEMHIDEVRILYKAYLNGQNLSANTVNTSLTDAFYLWRKGGTEVFWTTVTSTDFELVGKKSLLKALQKHSKGNANALLNSYMAHLRRFRRFIYGKSPLEIASIRPEKMTATKKSNMQKLIPMPSESVVEEYLLRWNTLENYQLQESVLHKLFFELCPENKRIEDVLLKAAALNDFYSTNIFSIYPVAKHICSLNIDERLKAGDATLVGDIQKVIIGGVTKNFYSFSTKYCSHHNALDFPIYDSYVDVVLRHFRKQDKFADFNDTDLKDYAVFKSILLEFRKFYGLEKFNIKQIDQYIWQLGKEYFPKKYKKEKLS